MSPLQKGVLSLYNRTMSIEQQLLLLAALAYLVGSIPFGLIVGKMKGIDPRTGGSGNIGATNVGRLLGKKYFWIVFTFDMLKGLLPMAIASYLARDIDVAHKPYLLWMLVGAAAFLGHLFPVWLKFKGGKGVATACGVLLGLWPYFTIPGLVPVIVFLLVFAMSKTVSLGSIFGSASFPIAYVAIGEAMGWPIIGRQIPLLVLAIAVPAFIIVKHKSNIARLLAGTEKPLITAQNDDSPAS
jgi:acyl phosphate:glycerol-3-phosphate acyltransferase